MFEIAARFNHACPPIFNLKYRFDGSRNILVMTVIKAVRAGEELLVTYGKRPADLYHQYGFRCGCAACEGAMEKEAGRACPLEWNWN